MHFGVSNVAMPFAQTSVPPEKSAIFRLQFISDNNGILAVSCIFIPLRRHKASTVKTVSVFESFLIITYMTA